MATISYQLLEELANSLGLSVVGVADAEALTDERERLSSWQSSGYAGDMAFMLRDPDLLTSPAKLLDGARSVLVIGAFYDRQTRQDLPRGHGRIARYAWGRDYHKVLRAKLKLLVALVEKVVGSVVRSRAFSDSVPLLERALARKALSGFIGKNTLFIVPRAGSFLFLGEIVWDLRVDSLPAESTASLKSKCGSCTNCLVNCPTDAFVDERVLDARKCISYLTIEKRGGLDPHERKSIGDWVFGCDVCQDVCPFNVVPIKRSLRADIAALEASSGAGQSVDLIEVISMRENEQFLNRFAGTPIVRTKREGLVRNASIVAANTHFAEALSALEMAAQFDASAVVRSHALWSCAEILRREGQDGIKKLSGLLDKGANDLDPLVRAEVGALRR
jgi:epoxyqueuosine reductase